MGIRKLISAFAALALAASSLGAMAITASADETSTIVSENFEGDTVIFDSGTVATTDNLSKNFGKVLKIANTTSTATFDTDSDTEGNQAISIAQGEKATVSYDAFHGYLNDSTTAVVTLYNSADEELASYTYAKKNGISNVAIEGTTVSGFETFSFQSKYSSNKGANGWSGNGKPYVGTDGYNPKITISVDGYGAVTMNFANTSNSIDNTYSGNLTTTTLDIAKVTIVDNTSNTDRSYGIDNFTITKETGLSQTANFTVKYVTDDGTTLSQNFSGSGEPGGNPVLADNMKADFVENSVKYSYVSDDSANVTLSTDETVTVTVTVKAHASVGSLAISYQADGTEVATGTYTLSGAYVGYSTTYYTSAYVIGADGALYKNTSTNYSGTVTPDTTTPSVTRAVKKAYESGSYVYYEDDDAVVAARQENFSNGMIDNVGLTSTDIITVPSDGTYDLIVYAGARTSANSNNTLTVTIAGVAQEDTIAMSNYAPNHTYSDLDLDSGDVISVVGNNDRVGVDYAVLVKTGDAVATEDKGYTFDDLKVSDVSDKTLKVSGTDSVSGAFSGEKAVSELISGTSDFSDDTNLVFGLIISDVPETATITSIVIE